MFINKLRELCCNLRLDTPTYRMRVVGFQLYECEVTLSNGDSYISSNKDDAKLAREECSEIAYKILSDSSFSSEEEDRKYVLIDLESISEPKRYRDLSKFRDSEIIGVGSFNCNSWDNIRSYLTQEILVESSKRDVADIYMCVYLGKILSSLDNFEYNEIIILTLDKFGDALSDVIRQMFPDIDIRFLQSASEI